MARGKNGYYLTSEGVRKFLKAYKTAKEDKELWDKVYAIEDKYRERGWSWAGEKVQKEMIALRIELDKRGWYHILFEDTKDYWKKYRAYKKANVEYVEKSVKIKGEEE